MFETNTQNNTSLISLARAAEITGYHQDYLGQLCRLGRLPAQKVGRNWFTSEQALKEMLSNVGVQAVEVIEEQIPEATPPDLMQEITIGKVEGLPIAMRTLPRPVMANNNVQSIVTSLRIESLQKEVAHLRSMLNKLMAEVARHTNLLEGRSSMPGLANQGDSLRHSYISNLDFGVSNQSMAPIVEEYIAESSDEAPSLEDWTPPLDELPRPSVMTWVIATASLAFIALIGAGVLTQTFFGSPVPDTTIVQYRQPKLQSEPEVAGANTEVLPTENIAPQNPNVVQ